MKNVSITKMQSETKVETPLKAETVKTVEAPAPAPVKDEEKTALADENGCVACPYCSKSFKLEAPAPAPVKDEEKTASADDNKEDKKDEEKAQSPKSPKSVKAEKVDPYAKGKSIKQANTAKYFQKDMVSEKEKAFANRLKQEFINGNKSNEELLAKFIK